jgi:hypothetical protein
MGFKRSSTLALTEQMKISVGRRSDRGRVSRRLVPVVERSPGLMRGEQHSGRPVEPAHVSDFALILSVRRSVSDDCFHCPAAARLTVASATLRIAGSRGPHEPVTSAATTNARTGSAYAIRPFRRPRGAPRFRRIASPLLRWPTGLARSELRAPCRRGSG